MGHYGEDRFYNPPMETVSRIDDGMGVVGKIPTRAAKGIELFPEKASQRGISILGLSSAPSAAAVGVGGGKELFPEKLGSVPPPLKRGDLAARITLPGSSASGVLGYHSDSGVGSEETSAASKGRGGTKAEDDLFAEKMVMGRRVGLGGIGGDLFDRIEVPEGSTAGGGSGGGRRRGRRNKAADLFG